MTLAPGSRLGPYEISGSIGAGGMGEVYRARDTRLDRNVAIKVLPSDFAGRADLRARFDREARTISQLSHPNICTLFDVGHENGVDYLVMELLEGETLAERLDKGPLPVADVLRYGAEIADALARAHRQGITHRDLKPGNVMLTKSGAKLLDFGLAKTFIAIRSTAAQNDATQQRPLTAEGTILGTFQYMAPEQLAGEEADARSDIFALGGVLYEMATGARAFSGKTRTSLVANILGVQPRPISELQPLTPPALEHLIQRCLAKDPDERWQSAADVAEELKWMRTQSSDSTAAGRVVPRTKHPRERVAWLIAALAVITAAALLVALQRARSTRPLQTYSSITPPAGASMAFGAEASGALAISPDSRYVTYTGSDASGVFSIWVRDMRTGNVRALPGTEGATYPFWSPDSRQLGFFLNKKLKTISAEGGATVDICDVNEPRGGSWSPDGVIVFTPHWRDPIYSVAATGGKPVAVTKVDPGRNETTHRWPTFLPDGKHFLFFAGSHTAETTSGDNAIYVGSIDGGEPRLLLRARSNVAYAAGRLLFLQGQKLVAQPFDAETLQLSGEAATIAEGVRYEKGFFCGVFAASDTLLAYQMGGMETKTQINWLNRKGETIGSLAPPGLFFDVSISPDGKTIALSIGDPSDIWLFDAARGVRNRFTFDAWQEDGAVWSPDSKTLLYWRDRDIQVDILRKSIGSAETVFLGDKDLHEKPLDWSRDGRFIVVAKSATSGSGAADLWVHPTDPTAKPFPFLVSPFNEQDARISPDGNLMAYVSDESGRNEVFVVSFPAAAERVLVSSAGGQAPRWRADGRELFFVSPGGEFLSVPITASTPSLQVGSAVSLFRAPVAFSPQPYYAVTGDGERFLINVRQDEGDEPVTLVSSWTALLTEK